MASAFVIGGAGTQAGRAWTNGGVYPVGGSWTFANSQGANGAAIYGCANAAVDDPGSGKVRITEAGEFVANLDGLYAYVAFGGGGYTDGHYEILLSDANSITIDTAHLGDLANGVTANAGGALERLDDDWQFSMDVATAGDSIKAGVGNHVLTMATNIDTNTGTKANPIIIEGVDSAGVRLTNGAARPVITTATPGFGTSLWLVAGASSCDYHEVRQLEFDGNGAAGATFAIGWNAGGADYWKAYDCRFTNCATSGCYWWSDAGAIVNCEFDDNLGTGGAAGLLCAGYNNLIVGCTAHDNAGHGFHQGTSNGKYYDDAAYANGADGFYFSSSDTHHVVNCVSDGNADNGFHFVTSVDDHYVYNNIASNNTRYGFDFDGRSYQVGFFGSNNSYNNTLGLCDETNDGPTWAALENGGNISSDPGFVDRANGDFTLTVGSASRAVGFPAYFWNEGAIATNYRDLGAVAGQVNYPAVGDVEDGVLFGTADGYEGTLGVPLESQVVKDVGYGEDDTELTGDYTVVAVGDVEDGVTFGAALGEEGTFAVPAEDDVRDGTLYGAAGVEFTGTYAITAPAVADYGIAGEIIEGAGEVVQYYADGGNTARQIYAVVGREPTDQIGGIAGAMASGITIRVANNSTVGIRSDEVDCGQDEVELPIRISGTNRRRRIIKVLEPGQGIDGQTGLAKYAVT